MDAGRTLLHYRVVGKIGEGGMGVVWKAVDTTLDREVAIKVLPEALAAEPDRLERFEREAKLLASLSHARIAALYGLHEAPSTPAGQAPLRFLSMELIEGEDLAQRLTRGPLTIERALRVALQIAEGLEAAHERGIVHRDLKPANVKRTGSGDVKILDFGLAKALEPPRAGAEHDLSQSPTMTAATQTGVILGTAAYMSPEQARGRPADRRTDVWAFGCVLYEMLAGRGVFQGATASDCIAGILAREPDWDALPPQTPRAVRRLLRRCLEKEPRRRLHDVADARIEIEETLARGTNVQDVAAPAPQSTATRSRIGWALAGLLLGVVATAVALSVRDSPDDPAPRRSPGRFAVSLPSGAPVVPLPSSSSVAISPDGARLVYVSAAPDSTDPGSNVYTPYTQLFTRRTDEYEVRAIEGTRGATAPFFSPDGEWVGFVGSDDGILKKIRLGGGVAVTLADGRLAIQGASWASDGRIFLGTGAQGLHVIPEDGGAVEALTEPDRERGEKTHRYPHVLPGGDGVLFTIGNSTFDSYDEASVALLDLRSGEHRVLLEGGSDSSYAASGHIVYGRAGSLEAVPFDLESMRLTGPPFAVADGVVTSDGWGSAHYGVSTGGTLAYVPGGPEMYRASVYWLDRQGNVEEVPLPPRPYGKAVFSPDGRRLVVSALGGNASIWIYEIERRTLTRLTSVWDNYDPIWTRGGSHVTFGSNRTGKAALWQTAADGSGQPEMIHEFENWGFTGCWSVGDEHLVFTSFHNATGWDLMLSTRGADRPLEPLLRTKFHETSATLSPDGRWLAYISDATGIPELYVQRFPVAGRKWQISAGGGDNPRWSPDGRELLYWKAGRLMAVAVATEPDFAPGRERELPQPSFRVLMNWDVAPDGQRFVVVGRVEADPTRPTSSPMGLTMYQTVDARVPEIRVVVDWLEELRRGSS